MGRGGKIGSTVVKNGVPEERVTEDWEREDGGRNE